MIAIEDVPMWTVDHRNIGHIVMMRKHGWIFTACDSAGLSFGDPTQERPKRICRRCRAKLKTLSLTPPEADHDPAA